MLFSNLASILAVPFGRSAYPLSLIETTSPRANSLPSIRSIVLSPSNSTASIRPVRLVRAVIAWPAVSVETTSTR